MRRTITVLAAAALFIAPGSAVAGCAWVLWENAIRPTADGKLGFLPSAWSPRQGFEKAEICLDAWKAIPAEEQKTFVYRCLPDTIDPRGPQGK
jgi:hypothetical protein